MDIENTYYNSKGLLEDEEWDVSSLAGAAGRPGFQGRP